MRAKDLSFEWFCTVYATGSRFRINEVLLPDFEKMDFNDVEREIFLRGWLGKDAIDLFKENM